MVIFLFSGKCSGFCEQPDDNRDSLAQDSAPTLQAYLEEAGLSVQVQNYRAHLYDDPQRGFGFLQALLDLDRIHADWVEGVDQPTQLVLMGYSHGTQFAHLLAMERPDVPFAASVLFDSICFGFDLHHAEAYLRELRDGQGLDGDPAVLGCKVLPVPGRGALDVGDVVPFNVAEAMEVWSYGFRESGLVRDVTLNARPDGSQDGLTRLLALDEGHSAIARPGSLGFARALDWLRGVLLRPPDEAAPSAVPERLWPAAPVMEVLDLFQEDTPFFKQSSTGWVEVDRESYVFGDRSLLLGVAGSEGQLNLRAVGLDPVDLRDRHLMLWLRVDGYANMLHATVALSSDDFRSFHSYQVAEGGLDPSQRLGQDGEWHVITIDLTAPLTRNGELDLAEVTGMQLSLAALGEDAVSMHVNGLATMPRPERGSVTVVFDDARDSVFTLARPVMEALGLRASVSVIADLAGQEGFMTVDQMRELEGTYGWEVIAHHHSELDLASAFDELPTEALVAELEAVRGWMSVLGFVRGAGHVAYPFGRIDRQAIDVVAGSFTSGRTVARSVGMETWPPADPYRLRAFSVRDADSVERLLGLIDQAEAGHGWLILVFHQLVDAAEAGHETFYTLTDFRTVMEHLARADVDVVLLSDR